MFAVGMVRGDDGYEERLAIEHRRAPRNLIGSAGKDSSRRARLLPTRSAGNRPGREGREHDGAVLKRCPDPLTDAPWASFLHRSFPDRCWSEPNFLSRAGPGPGRGVCDRRPYPCRLVSYCR